MPSQCLLLILRLAVNNITWKMPFFSQWRSSPILEYPSIQEGLAMGLKVIEDVSNDRSMSQ